MSKNKIIQIEKYFKSGQTFLKKGGKEVLTQMSPEDLQAAIGFILNNAFTEVRIGLGLVDPPKGQKELDIRDLKIFNKIADLYEEAAGGCYFCSSNVDPNEDEFGPETSLCLMCKLKLANYTEALGITASKVFLGMKQRKIQKTRIQMDENGKVPHLCH
ncbi:MAG: hypothetical protein C4518_01535 [Desulfobacteraceae bacterium]|nr:MAG: hypothetical protein C4518_01535 [Desulfobacteraceae bacterium]